MIKTTQPLAFCGKSIQYYFHAPKNQTRLVRDANYRKTLFGHWLLLTAGKNWVRAFKASTVWSLDLTLVDRLIQLNICSLDMNFETKWAKFQRFKQRYFLNSLALSERLLLVSYISASTITPLTKMQQQLASPAAVIQTNFTRLCFTLD